MVDISEIVHFCLRDIDATKRELQRQGLVSEFEIDYEIRMILFLVAHIDGEVSSAESRLSEAVARRMNWSPMYRNLLQAKIEKQPTYSLENLKIGIGYSSMAEILYSLGGGMALIDGNFSQDEQFLIANLADLLLSADAELTCRVNRELERLFRLDSGTLRTPDSTVNDKDRTVETIEPEAIWEENDPVDLDTCLAELDSLVGLNGVKNEIKRLVSYLSIQQKRKEMKLSQTNLSLHMVFTGNPGTGKTTVARLVARIYRALGFLEKGHLVESDRSGLVGQYIGHTDVKTTEVVNRALDGILFIDEAYSLYKGTGNDFGLEAINSLVKRMEDYRDRLIVIVAGYTEEMEAFINSNPGFRSRFNTYIEFDDFSVDELGRIFEQMCEANDYSMDRMAKKRLEEILLQEIERSGRGFGNGRFCRNLFEQILRAQAMRLSEAKIALTKTDLVSLEAKDFPVI
ncbi:MAG: Stage V sporulation protein K [Candidatus Moanabacter tarae]|uniref:Stage V sporulation protein K n=1 Tax=Candidatus Moanibacter tarae TaxID=2200854 RepID=A0A2Z4AEK5_9BACT|nr:MAG: Stage V sporulation protein K [Candidatus Moanabacter tarae]|tara:strand:- start:12181 stop:13554 length:1374 start_codon:yes stop_codon:yes gene_type:complete